MITSDVIENSQVYKDLGEEPTRALLLKKDTRARVQLGVNMAGLTSFENWVATTSPPRFIKALVRELHGRGDRLATA